jgi:putative glutamine amidotransferase
MRPVIGITPDVGLTAARVGRPPVPRYELKQAYTEAVLAAGGLPIVIPYSEDEDAPAETVSICDGVIITGGAFDIPPEMYGAKPNRKLGPLKPDRTHYELRVLRAALEQGISLLGICGGMQLLAVEAGGTLHQDIADEIPGAFDHEQKLDPRYPGHPVTVLQGTKLAQILGAREIQVNSTHHQAVHEPGRAHVSALSPDNVIEGIELSDARFAIGVQWHPELLSDPQHLALYRALVESTRS